jgi:phosphate transport system substrate-binding protein
MARVYCVEDLCPETLSLGCDSHGSRDDQECCMTGYRTSMAQGMRRTIALLAAGLVLAPLAVALTVTESGSTLIFPLFQAWVSAYTKIDPGLRMTTAATGSGAGIAQVIAKQVQIGTSDAYMSDTEAMANSGILNIPLAISAQTVDTNLPELKGVQLKLSGPVLADIYSGKIRRWDASPIVALNPGTRLPHHAIVPIHRADASGDTFIFTQFLTFSTAATTDTANASNIASGTLGAARQPADWETLIGYGTTVKWPTVQGSLTATGNDGMVQTAAHTPYSVVYIGTSFEAEAAKAGLQMAMLENQEGKFLLPTAATIAAAAASLTPRTPADERLTLVFAPGAGSYPLINYEYAMVSTRQENAQVAAAIRQFLLWCISPDAGSAGSFLGPVHFIPLPITIRALSEIQIAKIQ